jgi:hypothetical protein
VYDIIKSTYSEFPFMIEADALLEDTAFPTHTHGLTEVGWPEFIMDPFSLGGEGNGKLINNAYCYFKNNMNKLRAVLNGETLKYPVNIIAPGWQDEPIYTLCFRTVPATFEGVKLAYPFNIEPGMRFIQIWIDGDDFALTDEYYRGGAKSLGKLLF